jgi:hypothetical protein
MSVSARVCCDCYELGKVRTPPPQPELVVVDECGAVELAWDQPGADQFKFLDWLATACEHGPMGQLVSHRLGNIALITFLRNRLARDPNLFPILLTKVLYDGVHGGDFLAIGEVWQLIPEIELLKQVHADDEEDEPLVRKFEQQMRQIVQASLSIGKPISF